MPSNCNLRFHFLPVLLGLLLAAGISLAAQQPGMQAGSASSPRAESSRPEEKLIERAREATFAFSDKLPNFICEEFMARYVRGSSASGWKPMDVVSSEIIYEDGQESYRNVKLNDRPTNKNIQELSGSWSTGEFATTLNGLFHPSTATRFRFAEEANLAGRNTRIYDFEVARENSHWRVQSGSDTIVPAYQGSVWIDPESARVLRVEIQARDLPETFPMDIIESAVDYSFTRIGTESVLLPVHAETLGCHRDVKTCSRNIIDFRNYRKYTADSTITFE